MNKQMTGTTRVVDGERGMKKRVQQQQCTMPGSRLSGTLPRASAMVAAKHTKITTNDAFIFWSLRPK
jgi:hypothetical protein